MAKTKKSSSAIACDTDWEKKYQIERDLEALCRAESVKKDPKRMEACKALAKERLAESKLKMAEHQAMVNMGEGLNP